MTATVAVKKCSKCNRLVAELPRAGSTTLVVCGCGIRAEKKS